MAFLHVHIACDHSFIGSLHGLPQWSICLSSFWPGIAVKAGTSDRPNFLLGMREWLLFPFLSHRHRIIPFPIPTNSHSNTAFQFTFFHHLYSPSHPVPFPFSAATIYRLPLAEKCVYCVVIQNKIWSYSRSIVNNSPLISHHYNYHCLSMFTVQRLSACHCMWRWIWMGILFFTYKICYSHSH